MAFDIVLLGITVLSFLVNFGKEFYFCFTTRDVIKAYKIPDNIFECFITSVEFSIVNLIYCGWKEKDNIPFLIIFILCVLIMETYIFSFCLVYKTIKLVVEDNERELRVLKLLRYRVAKKYKVDVEKKYSRIGVEKLIRFLIMEIEKKYKLYKIKNEFENVYFGSSMLKNRESITKYDKKFKKVGTLIVLFATAIIYFVLIINMSGIEVFIFSLISIFVSLIIIGVGWHFNIWNIFAANRCFWSFEYVDDKKFNIAACSLFYKYDRGNEFIGTIEDLLSLYKIMLYNKELRKYRKIIIDMVESKLNNCQRDNNNNVSNLNKEHIFKTILILLYYLDYEKSKSKFKKNNKNRKKVKELINSMSTKSFEYQFADSILKYIYKECKTVEGKIIPEVLINP